MKINQMKVILAFSAIVMTTSVYANNKCVAAQKAYGDYYKLSTEWCATVAKPLSQKRDHEIKSAEKNCKRYTKRADKTLKRMFKECKNL